MPIPDFVLALRSRVGNDLLWMPGVSAVVIHRDGRLLLGRRADNGLWAVVSGILEPGEQPALAAVREVLEETGIQAVVEGLAAVSSSAEPVRYENGDRAQYLDLTFLCRAVGSDDPQVGDDESTAVGWFEADALPEPLMKSSRERIAQALAYRAHPEHGPWFARPLPLAATIGRCDEPSFGEVRTNPPCLPTGSPSPSGAP
jgi:ADP-ribose pyrophosphatase YjhB (NUDIX family)